MLPLRRRAGYLPAHHAAGIKTAVVSNFDTRLRQIMRELGVDELFDAVLISAEVRWGGLGGNPNGGSVKFRSAGAGGGRAV